MREHIVWQGPHAIDVGATVEVDTPEAWQAALPGQAKVSVLRLVDGRSPAGPGWCTVAGELQGPEIEVLCGGINDKQPTHAGIWRQGHLLHFGFEPSPGQMNDNGRKLLLNGIAYIARFTSDRPIVRERTFVDPDGSGAPTWRLDHLMTAANVDAARFAAGFAEPWRAQLAALSLAEARAFVQQRLPALCAEGRLFAFDRDALALGVDVRADGVLRQLVERLQGAEAEAASALLARLLPDGPGAGTTPANWRHWLSARQAALCHDPHSHVWRLDPLAQARSVPSPQLRGPQRADGAAEQDPQAAALVAKVVARHGGARALEDLTSLRVAQGDVRYLWDRRAGVFRMEHHGSLAAGQLATPWRVAIFDTAAGVDLLRGGGPEPKPFVSARGAVRELHERLLLPLLLSGPGTKVHRLADDAEGKARLQVQPGGRNCDPRRVHVLHVDPGTGDVVALDVLSGEGGRVVTWRVTGTMQVGPLLLPCRFERDGRNAQAVEYGGAAWNPPVPEGAATATEMLLGER